MSSAAATAKNTTRTQQIMSRALVRYRIPRAVEAFRGSFSTLHIKPSAVLKCFRGIHVDVLILINNCRRYSKLYHHHHLFLFRPYAMKRRIRNVKYSKKENASRKSKSMYHRRVFFQISSFYLIVIKRGSSVSSIVATTRKGTTRT